jgi:uncharacterized protein (TIGR02246 family)
MLKRPVLATLVLAAAIAATFGAVTALHAQESAPAASSAARPADLTALDYLEIQQLVARYAYALDSGADAGRMYASLFAPDGAFVETSGNRISGHDALAALAVKHQVGPMVVYHFITNHTIEPSAEGAIGKQYLAQLKIGEKGAPSEVAGAGHYEDSYVKTEDGWRFSRRQYIRSKTGDQPDYAGPLLNVTPQVSQTAPPGAGQLTPADYVEIQQLVSRYPYGLDTGADSGYMFADVFTPDGSFTSGGMTHTGREELKALALEHYPGQGPLYVRNFHTNVWIEPSPEGAVGRVFLFVIDIDDTSKRLLDGGHYQDQYVRTPNGWRIKSRTYRPDADGPPPANLPMPPVTVHTLPEPLVRAKAGNTLTLTAQDYVDIQQLAAAYSHALDIGDGTAYANLFTRDATAFDRWIGREKIAEIPPWNPHGPDYVRHFAMNHLIEPTADGAIGKQYVVVIDFERPGKPTSIYLGGQYQDVYVKTPEGWRFRSRTEFRSGSNPTTGARD